jgi:hypothetical protein
MAHDAHICGESTEIVHDIAAKQRHDIISEDGDVV